MYLNLTQFPLSFTLIVRPLPLAKLKDKKTTIKHVWLVKKCRFYIENITKLKINEGLSF